MIDKTRDITSLKASRMTVRFLLLAPAGLHRDERTKHTSKGRTEFKEPFVACQVVAPLERSLVSETSKASAVESIRRRRHMRSKEPFVSETSKASAAQCIRRRWPARPFIQALSSAVFLAFLLLITSGVHAASFNSWRADQAYKKGDYVTARHLYEEATLRHPDDMRALYNVGKTAYKAKDYEAAQAAFEKVSQSALSEPPLKEQAFFNKGDSQLMDKQYQKALTSYYHVLELNSANEHAKKRIELVKKLLEDQKQNEQQNQNNQDNKQNDKQSDNKQSGEQSSTGQSQKDEQDEQSDNESQEKRDSSKDDSRKNNGSSQNPESGPDQSQSQRPQNDSKDASNKGGQQGKDQNHRQQQQTQKDSKESERKHKASQDERTEGSDKPDNNKGSNKEQNDERKGHNNPQQDSVSKQEKGNTQQAHAGGTAESLPEKQLNDQDKKNLQIIEGADKEAYKAFFRVQAPAGDETDGYKNW